MTVHEMLSEGEDSVRHATPISDEELVSMIDYVLETRSYTAASNPEWTVAVDSPSVHFIKRSIKSSGTVRTRSWAKVPGVPPQALFKCVYDCALRLQFDKYFTRFEVSRSIDHVTDVVVSQLDSPVGISDREFVEWRRCFLPELRDKSSMVYAIELRSCDDSQCSASVRPSSKRVERAETWLSGYVFKWWLDENGEPIYASAEAIAAGEAGLGPAQEELIPTYIKSPGSATYDSLRDFATEEPEQVARVLRTWIST